jgi:hypothetical protein
MPRMAARTRLTRGCQIWLEVRLPSNCLASPHFSRAVTCARPALLKVLPGNWLAPAASDHVAVRYRHCFVARPRKSRHNAHVCRNELGEKTGARKASSAERQKASFAAERSAPPIYRGRGRGLFSGVLNPGFKRSASANSFPASSGVPCTSNAEARL